MPTNNSLYTLLQVLPGAEPAVIEAAYRALMKKHHPDLHGGEDAQRRAAEISHAFNVLRDPERRAAYDAEEKASEERRKIELARAFPEHHGTGEGARRPPLPIRYNPPPRPGQRVAGWMGALGALALVGTVIVFARGTPQPVNNRDADPKFERAVSPGAAATPAAVHPAVAPVPFRDQPVSRESVQAAVKEFLTVSEAGGIDAAARYSEQCFESQVQSRDVNDFDRCVAFDHAAGRAELAISGSSRSAAQRRFEPQVQVSRHVRAADPLADSFASIELRLFEIRRLADSVITELALASRPAEAFARPTSDRRPLYTGQTASQRPRTNPRARTKQQEQDFLEREGGIY